MLMFFGGAVLALTVQFFVVPANLDALPGLAGDCAGSHGVVRRAGGAAAGGVAPPEPGPEVRWFVVGAAAATVLALLDPGLDRVVIGTALVAAVLLATTVRRPVRPDRGLVAIIVLALLGDLTWSFAGCFGRSWPWALWPDCSPARPAVSASDPQPHEQPLPSLTRRRRIECDPHLKGVPVLAYALDLQRVRQYLNHILRAQMITDAVREDRIFLDQVRRGFCPCRRPSGRSDRSFPQARSHRPPALAERRVGVIATGGSGAQASVVGVARRSVRRRHPVPTACVPGRRSSASRWPRGCPPTRWLPRSSR